MKEKMQHVYFKRKSLVDSVENLRTLVLEIKTSKTIRSKAGLKKPGAQFSSDKPEKI